MFKINQLRRVTIFSLSIISLFFFFGCEDKAKKEEIKEERKPNIILILADDLGYGDIGCYGQKFIQTPQIDKMASEGLRFTRHYAGSTVCAPSRCSLMTGLDMGHAEVRGNKQDEPFGQIPLSKNTLTVAEILQKAGYKTGLIGKWGLGIENTTGEPNKMGFDFYYGYLDQVLAHNSNPEYLLRNGKKEYLNNEVNYLSKDDWHKGLGSYATKKVDHSHELFENETLKFIVENKNDPFFLYLPYIIPHDNGEALLGNRIEISDQGIYKDKDWENDHKNYAAAITRLDETVGKILQSLKENKLDKNTIVIFTSDNGPEMNYDFTDFFDSNGELKGGKRDLYEGGIRVPFIAWFPDKIKPGVSDHLSAFWDFLPSAAELAGAQMPEQINGLSYTPTLFGKSDEQKQHDQLYWEFPEQGKKQAIIVGDWKLHHFVNENRYELYNLSEDISEKENLIESNPQKFHALKTKMENARTESIEFPL